MTNVLFITVDQWRGECLSALNHPCLKTPHLDKLAADGVLFNRHYAQTAPCGPSRASLYTGLYLHHHRVVSNSTPLDARFTNIALESRKAGYEPVLFGYTDTAPDPRTLTGADPKGFSPEGVLPGMQAVVPLKEDFRTWIVNLQQKGYEFRFDTWDMFTPDQNAPDTENRALTFAPAKYCKEDSPSAFLVDETMKWLSVNNEKPWFIHLSLLAAHPPFIAPDPYHKMYHPDEVPPLVRAATVEQEVEQHPYPEHVIYNPLDSPLSFGFDNRNYHKLSHEEMLQIKATYYGMMSEVDDQIGRLLNYLKSSDDYKNTLIVFTSDHGEQLGDHWQLSKFSYFEKTFHVPLIIKPPDVGVNETCGSQVEDFTESVDVMPTILDYLDLELHDQCDGTPLTSFLKECRAPSNWRTEVHSELDFRNYMNNGNLLRNKLELQPDQCGINIIRGKRYKYIHFTKMKSLFFDLQEDPGEFNNLIDHPDYREKVLEYAQKLISWRMNQEERTLANTRITPQGIEKYTGPRR